MIGVRETPNPHDNTFAAINPLHTATPSRPPMPEPLPPGHAYARCETRHGTHRVKTGPCAAWAGHLRKLHLDFEVNFVNN